MNFGSLSIRTRIVSTLLVLAVSLVVVGGLGLYGMNGVVDDLDDMYNRRVVVMNEVRSLAQRSATAAKEIKDLIGDSVEKVRSGSALVDESGKVLGEIMESVKKVSDIVAEIAAASEEQAQGIDQVNNAVTQMDDTTQQNAALVEEASSAAKSMEQQAQQLVAEISFFRAANSPTPAHAVNVVATKPHVSSATVRPMPRPAVKRAPAPSPAAASVPMAKASGDDSAWQEF